LTGMTIHNALKESMSLCTVAPATLNISIAVKRATAMYKIGYLGAYQTHHLIIASS